jgi:hypothetical protein
MGAAYTYAKLAVHTLKVYVREVLTFHPSIGYKIISGDSFFRTNPISCSLLGIKI